MRAISSLNSLLQRSRRGVSLLEAVAVVVILAVAVPPTIMWLDESTSHRADAMNTTRAGMFATIVMENILADSASTASDLGFAAFANSNQYLNTATTGLRDRISPSTSFYEAMGMTYAVTIGVLVGPNGTTTGSTSTDIFRIITVSVTFNSAVSGTQTLSISSFVTAP